MSFPTYKIEGLKYEKQFAVTRRFYTNLIDVYSTYNGYKSEGKTEEARFISEQADLQVIYETSYPDFFMFTSPCDSVPISHCYCLNDKTGFIEINYSVVLEQLRMLLKLRNPFLTEQINVIKWMIAEIDKLEKYDAYASGSKKRVIYQKLVKNFYNSPDFYYGCFVVLQLFDGDRLHKFAVTETKSGELVVNFNVFRGELKKLQRHINKLIKIHETSEN